MARGKRASPEDVYKVIASYAVTGSIRQTARELNMPVTSVKNIIDAHKNDREFERLRTQKKDEFVAAAARIINKALARLEAEIDDKETKIPVNYLTTVIGTLYDKKALAEGKATDNVTVNIKLPEGIDDYAG